MSYRKLKKFLKKNNNSYYSLKDFNIYWNRGHWECLGEEQGEGYNFIITTKQFQYLLKKQTFKSRNIQDGR